MPFTEEILKSCAEQDRRAVKMLYEHCYKQFIRMCMGYFSNHEDARFALNNGFLKIINGLQTVDLKTLQFNSWAKRIIANSLIDEYRKNKNHNAYILPKDTDRDLEYHGTNSFNKGEQDIEAQEIMDLLTTIPAVSAHVFRLFVIDGFGHKEIAELLDITEGTSKWHLSTARKLLREKLERIESNNNKRFAI